MDEIRDFGLSDKLGHRGPSGMVWEVQVRCSKIRKGETSGKRTARGQGFQFLSKSKLQILCDLPNILCTDMEFKIGSRSGA